MRVPNLAGLAMGAVTLTIFLVAGDIAADALIQTQQSRQLRELADTALRRAEASVRQGVQTLDEVARQGSITCDQPTLQSVRLHVYQHGSVKDVRFLDHDGTIRCSAYPDTLEFDKDWVGRDQMLAADEDEVRLFQVKQFSGTALGVQKDVGPVASLAAIVGFDNTVLDIMPDELRALSEVTLQLTDGRTLAQSHAGGSLHADDVTLTQTRSKAFPLGVQIRVDQAALTSWHRQPYWPIVLAASLIGLAFGALLARIAARAPDPVVELDDAIATNQFKPYFQPLFDLRTGRIVGCEALARWVRPDGTVIAPARFIPLAENSGRIDAITRQIFCGALAALRAVITERQGFRVSVNIVPENLLDPKFCGMIGEMTAEAGFTPRQIILEVTERQQVDDLKTAAATIADLRRAGFGVALDDVGVGHSGLSSIQALGASTIKIDKFFVDAVCRDQTAGAIVQMLVRLAKELHMCVVAEGIEDIAQSHALAAMGVDLGQGYLVSPPLPADRFLAFLTEADRSGEAGLFGLRDVAGLVGSSVPMTA